jgi:hypothetical protein
MPVMSQSVAEGLRFTEAAGVAPVRASTVEFWPRWIAASVARHVDDRRRGLPLFLEGMDHVEGQPEWIEVRVDGPYILEPSKGWFEVAVEVNVLVCTAKDAVNLYRHHDNVGTVAQAMNGPIGVFKLGTGADDDQTLLGCLTLVRSYDQREALRVSHFGQLAATTPLMRSSVEGHYAMRLHG